MTYTVALFSTAEPVHLLLVWMSNQTYWPQIDSLWSNWQNGHHKWRCQHRFTNQKCKSAKTKGKGAPRRGHFSRYGPEESKADTTNTWHSLAQGKLAWQLRNYPQIAQVTSPPCLSHELRSQAQSLRYIKCSFFKKIPHRHVHFASVLHASSAHGMNYL